MLMKAAYFNGVHDGLLELMEDSTNLSELDAAWRRLVGDVNRIRKDALVETIEYAREIAE
jgi:hypothetical protein